MVSDQMKKIIGGSGMIKTIKVKMEMNFRELMEYILENDIRDRVFRCSIDDHVFRVCEDGFFDFYCVKYNIGEIYEVEVEEEITEDTTFNCLVEITNNSSATCYHSLKIEDIVGSTTKKIYALIDGELKLVWERE